MTKLGYGPAIPMPEMAFDGKSAAMPLLHERTNPMALNTRGRRFSVTADNGKKFVIALDDDPDDGGTVSPDRLDDAIAEMITKFLDGLGAKADPADVEDCRSRWLDGPASDRRRRRGMAGDDPPEFPGRPRVGGGMDRKRPMAGDAALRRSSADDDGFSHRHPAAAKVGLLG